MPFNLKYTQSKKNFFMFYWNIMNRSAKFHHFLCWFKSVFVFCMAQVAQVKELSASHAYVMGTILKEDYKCAAYLPLPWMENEKNVRCQIS